MNQAEGVFAGLRVLDVGSFVAAPAAATVLSDFGAQVIKIEPPNGGDPYRTLAAQPGFPESEHDYCWTLDSRNKRSLALDLGNPDGRRVLHRLVSETDIFVTNMPLRVRERLGIAYETLAVLNERLIYASFTAYGETGEQAHMPGFDSTAWWARSGLMDQVRPDGQSPPARSLPAMGDHQAALSLFGAIVTALYRRERTGKGGYVGSSLLANGAWSNGCYLQAALCGAKFTDRPPRTLARTPLSNHYRCQDDRWLLLSMSVSPSLEERSWPAFTEILGHPEWATDARFATRQARQQNNEQLIAALDQAFAARDAHSWHQALTGAGVTVSIVMRATDLVADPQMLATGVLVPLPGSGGAELTVSSPFWVEGAEKVAPQMAPQLGEHTDMVLRDLGLAPAEIGRLREAGVIA